MSQAVAEAFAILPPLNAIDDAVFAAVRAGAIAKSGAGFPATIEFQLLPARRAIRVVAGTAASPITALTLATMAALELCARLGGTAIESARLVNGPPRRSAPAIVTDRATRPRPQTLMGEVSAPPPDADLRREAFRAFMTRHRLRPTLWAKEAGVPAGEILGFLTGRSRGFSGEVAEKLARAAKVRVEEMFPTK